MDSLKAKIGGLKSAPRMVGERASADIESDIRENYASQRDPYGDSWAPRKSNSRDDGHPILDDTGTLKGSREIKINDDGSLDISYDDDVASFHQTGTRKMVARPLLPTAARGTPKRWSAALQKAFRGVVAELFGR